MLDRNAYQNFIFNVIKDALGSRKYLCPECCYFQNIDHPDVEGGECRIKAPIIVGNSARGKWPRVSKNDSCGSGRPNDEVLEALVKDADARAAEFEAAMKKKLNAGAKPVVAKVGGPNDDAPVVKDAGEGAEEPKKAVPVAAQDQPVAETEKGADPPKAEPTGSSCGDDIDGDDSGASTSKEAAASGDEEPADQ